MPKKILVTGGAGFIGSHVVDTLVKRGHKVYVVDNLSSGRRDYVNPKAKLFVLDIRSPKLKSLCKKIKPDSVVHLAAHIDLRNSYQDPQMDADINLLGGLNVIEACGEAGTKQITFASSAAVYGFVKKPPVKESAEKQPTSPYGIAKYAFEFYLNFAREKFGMKASALRFANVYGPRQTAVGEAGVVAIFTDLLLQGKTPNINGNGKQTRDFVFVLDVADMVTRCATKQIDGIFNVSTGQQTSVLELYSYISKSMKIAIKPTHGPAKPGDDMRLALDPNLAKRKVGWGAKVSVVDGINKTVTWSKSAFKAGRPIR